MAAILKIFGRNSADFCEIFHGKQNIMAIEVTWHKLQILQIKMVDEKSWDFDEIWVVKFHYAADLLLAAVAMAQSKLSF